MIIISNILVWGSSLVYYMPEKYIYAYSMTNIRQHEQATKNYHARSFRYTIII